MTISEAHQLFLSDFPGTSISLSMFVKRPQFVWPTSDKDHDVCMCRYHENVALLAAGIHKVAPNVPSDVLQHCTTGAAVHSVRSRKC